MNWPLKIQGRFLHQSDVEEVRELLRVHPHWGRTRISEKLCQSWNWRRPDGQWKNMACRELLRKLEQRGLVTLPARQSSGPKRAPVIPAVEIDRSAVRLPLSAVQPLQITDARDRAEDERLFNYLLKTEHYLGFSRPVGQNIKYLVRSSNGVVLGCLLFGAAAWKVHGRDQFIGWDVPTRKTHLNLLTNNTRFLIPPWVDISCLASHILGKVIRRLPEDWQRRYGMPVVLLETFVDRSRYAGTSYQAANFLHIGHTRGRSRQDRYNRLRVPIKDIYVYPFRRDFRHYLGV